MDFKVVFSHDGQYEVDTELLDQLGIPYEFVPGFNVIDIPSGEIWFVVPMQSVFVTDPRGLLEFPEFTSTGNLLWKLQKGSAVLTDGRDLTSVTNMEVTQVGTSGVQSLLGFSKDVIIEIPSS